MTNGEIHLQNASNAKRVRNMFRRHHAIKINANGTIVNGSDIAAAMDKKFNQEIRDFISCSTPDEIAENAYRIANLRRSR